MATVTITPPGKQPILVEEIPFDELFFNRYTFDVFGLTAMVDENGKRYFEPADIDYIGGAGCFYDGISMATDIRKYIRRGELQRVFNIFRVQMWDFQRFPNRVYRLLTRWSNSYSSHCSRCQKKIVSI